MQLPNEISGTFNKPITLGVGTVGVYNIADNSLVVEFDQTDITIDGTGFSIPFSEVTENGEYRIDMSAGLFISGDETFGAFSWFFSVGSGYYSPTYYPTEYYLT